MEMVKKFCTKKVFASLAMVTMMALVFTVAPTFATATVPDTLVKILDQMIAYIGIIFQVVGILLGIYAVGQMIMAFKDENPDAKQKASTLLVVCILLIALPQIIKQLDLGQFLGK